MTIIRSTISHKFLTITQDPRDHDEAVVGVSFAPEICVKKADLRAALDAIDPQPAPDAIDAADWRSGDRVEIDYNGERVIVGRETVGKYVGGWALPNGLHYDDHAIAPRNPKAVPAPAKGSDPKPYRPVDRDRLLRHIEDIEATLTRRNERHEQDQERIRELEAEVFTLREIKDSYEEPKTAREYLEMAWEQAIVPEDGLIHGGEAFLAMADNDAEVRGAYSAPYGLHAREGIIERRLLDPRVEPTEKEKRRKDYEDAGLAEWEIELLMESER